MTRAQWQTLVDVADGKVRVNRSWTCYGARADVLGRLEERSLIEVDWEGEPHGRVTQSYPAVITEAGRRELALAEGVFV